MATKEPLFDIAELKVLLVVTLLLAFGFAYRFSGPATLSNWFGNFILMIILVGISVLVHEIFHRKIAGKFVAKVRSKIWLSGVVIFLILLLLTNGSFIFAAIWAITITPLRLLRPGRLWPHLGPRERALIAASGPLANLGLAIVAKILQPVLGLLSEQLIIINIWLAVINLIPFFTLLPIIAAQKGTLAAKPIETPYVEGEFLFFGNRPLWVLVFFFTLVAGIGLVFLGLFASIILALVLALAIFIAWHYFLEPESGIPAVKMGGPHGTTAKGPSFRKYK